MQYQTAGDVMTAADYCFLCCLPFFRKDFSVTAFLVYYMCGALRRVHIFYAADYRGFTQEGYVMCVRLLLHSNTQERRLLFEKEA